MPSRNCRNVVNNLTQRAQQTLSFVVFKLSHYDDLFAIILSNILHTDDDDGDHEHDDDHDDDDEDDARVR